MYLLFQGLYIEQGDINYILKVISSCGMRYLIKGVDDFFFATNNIQGFFLREKRANFLSKFP